MTKYVFTTAYEDKRDKDPKCCAQRRGENSGRVGVEAKCERRGPQPRKRGHAAANERPDRTPHEVPPVAEQEEPGGDPGAGEDRRAAPHRPLEWLEKRPAPARAATQAHLMRGAFASRTENELVRIHHRLDANRVANARREDILEPCRRDVQAESAGEGVDAQHQV